MSATQKNNQLLIGLGGTGKTIIEKVFSHHPEYDYLICNSDNIYIEQSRYYHIKQPDFIDINPGKPPCHKDKFRLSEEQVNELTPLLLAHTKTTLIVGLGGLTGTVLSKEITFLAKNLKTNLTIIAFLPFFFETTRCAIASKAQKELQMMNAKVKTIDHAQESKAWDKDSNLEEYINYADDMAFSMIQHPSEIMNI